LFKINGETWFVELVSPFHPSLRTREGFYTLGCCDDKLKTIFIAADLSDYKFKRVLCHEIVHAAMFSYNVQLSYEEEEVIADLIAIYGQEIIDITNKLFFNMVYKVK